MSTFANSEDPDETQRLFRAFPAHTYKVGMNALAKT